MDNRAGFSSIKRLKSATSSKWTTLNIQAEDLDQANEGFKKMNIVEECSDQVKTIDHNNELIIRNSNLDHESPMLRNSKPVLDLKKSLKTTKTTESSLID